MKYFGVAEFSCLPVNDSCARACWHYIATGEIQDEDWYRGLNQTECDQNINEYVEDHRQQEYTENVVQTPHEEEGGDIDMVPAASDDISDTTFDDKIIQEYLDYQEKLNSKMFSRLNDKVTRKAFLKLKNFFKSLANSNDDTRNRKIFDICSDGKKKIGNTIRVQPTSIARRKNKNRGRGVSSYGRRVKDSALLTQLSVDENSEQVYHAPAHRNTRSNRITHDLQRAVNEQRQNAKKH